MVGGDPLGGGGFAAPTPAPTAYPQGYTTPPPPGAAGPAYVPPPPAQSAFGSSAALPGAFVLAGWWRRVGAAVVDGFIITTVALIIMAPLGVGFFANRNGSSTGFFALVAALFVAMLVIAVVALAYAPLMMARTNGQTIGRMATGIRVVRANGQPITLGFAAIREVAVKALLVNAVAGGLTGGLAPLLDILWPLWDDENRALHDMVVDTRTVMS
jgi:uncharacterized RDD family membrane protein YckC